jgi:RND superfamily putative drug exporter
VSLALVYVIAHFLDTSIYVTEVITFLGLGIGIDYSLFIVYRFREELQARHDVETAVVRTMATTGRAVFFSGLTVAIGLSSLILTNVSFMVSMGLGGMLVPLTSLLVAMTLLPAMLGVLGHRINRLRVVPRRLVGTGEGRVWRRLATIIMRRPAVAGEMVFALLLGLTLPVTQLNFAFGSLKNAPRHLESVEGALSMQHSFPTTPNPTQVVIEHRGPGTLLDPREIAGMRELERSIRHDPEALKVVGLPDVVPGDGVTGAARHSQAVGRFVTPDGRSALISVVARHDVGTKGAEDLVRHIRAMASRASAGALRGNEIHVGGAQASYTDFNDALYDHFPLIVAIVLALSYLFLFYAFRSAFLPLKAVLLNLLSVGAAYGMLQLVFQRGIGASVLGFTPESGVAGWVPIMMFAFLFGLSMDYEVFLLSRIREAWLDSGHNGEAVTSGLQKTGRLITSAAAIMIVAFSGFLIGGVLTLKEFGFGLLASIALDATLIRLVLVPSIMQLVGNVNWWVPGFLRGFAARAGSFETLDDSAEELELAS